MLERSSPAANSRVTAPAEIRLTFSEPIEPRFSRVRLAKEGGQRVATGTAVVVRNQLILPLPRLAPGKYLVSWSVVSVDSHKIEGAFSFEVTP